VVSFFGYPLPRKREATGSTGGFGRVVPGVAGAPSLPRSPRGDIIQFNATFAPAALEFHGFSSYRIGPPCVIASVTSLSTVARNASIVFTIEVADTDDVATIAGTVFPRVTIFDQLTTGKFVFPTTTWQSFFPNHHESQGGRYVKMWLFNNAVASVSVDVSVGVIYL